jgi:hypothetical protein
MDEGSRPGQYELMEPDAEGRWALVANKTNSLTFTKDSDGNVISMILHKPTRSFEMQRDNPSTRVPER